MAKRKSLLVNMLGNNEMKNKFVESFSAVLPITAIVLILSITVAPIESGPIVLFLFGVAMLIVGMSLFTMGVDMSMMPMGEGIGATMAKPKNKLLPVTLAFFLGVIVTIAEPDLTVLANQIPTIENMIIILAVALGVGIFFAFAQIRSKIKLSLSTILIICYTAVFVLAFFAPDSFIPASFDSGGVTTGPITVPFIMAFGVGLASLSTKKNAQADSFGIVALCSVGPILAVLILGIVFNPSSVTSTPVEIPALSTTADAFNYFLSHFPEYFVEVAVALAPIIGVFLLFEICTRRYKKHQLIRILSGFIYTYLGLTLFLTGANVGFMPVGNLLGTKLASSGAIKWLLIPVGALVGYFIVSAEPAVHVLKKQVEEVSNGAISQRAMGIALSLGVSVSVGLSMLRILTGISILWFLIPGYAIALSLTFIVPQLFTAVAFDAGGVASGPMTATFLLPLAMGACTALGGNLMTDAFGTVAMVAMTPLVTIQVLGLVVAIKKKISLRRLNSVMTDYDDKIIYFD